MAKFALGVVDSAKSSVQSSIAGAIEEVQAVPERLTTAATQALNDAVDEVKAAPGKLQDAATQAAAEAAQEAQAAAEAKVSEIKAIPSNALGSIKSAISGKTQQAQDEVAEARRRRDEQRRSK